MGDPSCITYRKHTFLSSAAMGLSAIVITLILSGTGVLVYGIHLASEKSERVISLAQGAVRGLPMLTESLPPVLSECAGHHGQADHRAGTLRRHAHRYRDRQQRLRGRLAAVVAGTTSR